MMITTRLRLRPLLLRDSAPEREADDRQRQDEPVGPAEKRKEGKERQHQRNAADREGEEVQHPLNMEARGAVGNSLSAGPTEFGRSRECRISIRRRRATLAPGRSFNHLLTSAPQLEWGTPGGRRHLLVCACPATCWRASGGCCWRRHACRRRRRPSRKRLGRRPWSPSRKSRNGCRSRPSRPGSHRPHRRGLEGGARGGPRRRLQRGIGRGGRVARARGGAGRAFAAAGLLSLPGDQDRHPKRVRPAFTAYKPFFCYVEAEGSRLNITKQTGSQRPAGWLYNDMTKTG